MAGLESLKPLTGRWTGTNRLWLDPEQPSSDSAATAHVEAVANGKFVRIDYTWSHKGQPHSGSLLVGFISAEQKATMNWVDSFHMNEAVLSCDGKLKPDGVYEFLGSYAAPPGPDWGWRTEIVPAKDSWRIVMYNIWPEGRVDLAVEMAFTSQVG